MRTTCQEPGACVPREAPQGTPDPTQLWKYNTVYCSVSAAAFARPISTWIWRGALDPMNSGMSAEAIRLRVLEGRYTEAIALSRQLLERYPNQLGPHVYMNLSYIEAGQAELALKNLRALETRFPPARFFEVMALGKLGRNEEGLRLLRQLEAEYGKDTRVYRQWFAFACAGLGDHAETLKWLEKSADLHEFQVLTIAVNPAFAAMRNDPGFRALMKRIGL